MRIVNRDTFISLPEGTVFCEYTPQMFGNLMVKGESIVWEDGNDYLELSLNDSINFEMLEIHSINIPMDFDGGGRNGCFKYDQLYAVWDRKDVEGLIARLNLSLMEAY